MTEKLTYDPTPADAPELSPEEQDSLEVAEKLGQEEAKTYAGKFENAEELEKAYIELQKKLGSDEKEEGEKPEAEKPEEKEEPEVDETPAMAWIDNATKEWSENEGKLSDETMAKISEMSSKDLVEAYMRMQPDRDPNEANTPADLTDAEINTIQNSVGGEKEYQKMMAWAGQNMDQSKLDAFNSIINTASVDAVSLAVSGMKAEYENAEGYEGRMLSGKAPKTNQDVFNSQAELVRAIADPRYEKDEAYQQEVYKKLERSNNVKF
jgi:hypothetical protein